MWTENKTSPVLVHATHLSILGTVPPVLVGTRKTPGLCFQNMKSFKTFGHAISSHNTVNSVYRSIHCLLRFLKGSAIAILKGVLSRERVPSLFITLRDKIEAENRKYLQHPERRGSDP